MLAASWQGWARSRDPGGGDHVRGWGVPPSQLIRYRVITEQSPPGQHYTQCQASSQPIVTIAASCGHHVYPPSLTFEILTKTCGGCDLCRVSGPGAGYNHYELDSVLNFPQDLAWSRDGKAII